ncbi:MAG: PEP/pyruvate-binding domain-containing protein [Candidatus Abyssubacteria bacterium]
MFEWYKRYLKKRADEKATLADRQLESLRFRYHAFKNLLITNNDLLEQMTRMEMYLQERRKVFPGLRDDADKLLKLALDLVQNLNYIADGAYTDLFQILRPLSSRLKALASEIDPGGKVPLIFPLDDCHPDLVAIVGGKAAPLGVLKRDLGLPVPDGFVITTEACRFFFERNGLNQPIRELLREVSGDDLRAIERASQKIRAMVLSGRIPQELREAMERAYAALWERRAGSITGVAVRSSAVPEDGNYSFAGQFSTVLNVTTKEAFLEAYKEVIASGFNETSLIYRLHREMRLPEAEMAVLCLEMVPARSAGTLYTVDPNDMQGERMVLSSIWGLGEYLVNGRLPADIFHVSRLDQRHFELAHLAKKEVQLVCDIENGGTREAAVADADSLGFSVDEQQIRKLCEYGLVIEKYMGYPQDVEWAITQDGGPVILQSRRLHVWDRGQEKIRKGVEDLRLLMERGVPASRGLATGRVAVVHGEEDLGGISPGSVLVAQDSFLRIVKVISHLRGIILERGNPLEHLACVAREYRIPMLVRAAGACRILQSGQVITLDADDAKVYEGEAKIMAPPPVETDVAKKSGDEGLNPLVEELRRLIFPLTLLDVRDPNFRMTSCKSIHDVVRFCHEQGIQSMFEVNDGEYSKNRFYVSRLVTPIPFTVEAINLGGGFSVAGHPRTITIEQVTSVPFLAFWRGVSHPAIRWSGPPVRVSLKAFGSVLSNTMLDAARSGRPLGARTYALLSRDYMNLNSRLAYHFAMVDTLCSQDAAANYVNFRFKGGGTSLERRVLRVRFIGRILESLGFYVNMKQDLLNGALKGLPLPEMEEKLDMIGRLLGCSRLLDMAMEDEATMEWFVDAFLHGNYGFE